MPRPRLKAPVEGPAPEAPFIAYFRVSTEQQGRSGLGLEAQRASVVPFVRSRGGRLAGEYVEVESGKRNDRPQLAAALAACRAGRATLVVAKLDRLARNVAFISALMESGVNFVAAETPEVNRLTLHILAAVAEEEARAISSRTKAALAAAKARGVKLGNPAMRKGMGFPHAWKGRKALVERADQRARDLLPEILLAHREGHVSHHQVARYLTKRHVLAPGGGEVWSASQVARILARAREKV